MLHRLTTGAGTALLAVLSLIAAFALHGSARAGSLLIEPGGEIEAVSLIEEEFVIILLNGPRVVCPMTLTLEVSTSAEKTRGVVFGTVEEVDVGTCTEGGAVRPLGLPWSISYQSITGGLPSEISEVLMTVHDVQFLLTTCEFRCLFQDDVNAWLALFHILPEEPYVNQLLLLWDSVEVNRTLTGRCPAAVVFLGDFSLEPTQRIVDS